MTINERVSDDRITALLDCVEMCEDMSVDENAEMAAALRELQQYRAAAEPVAWMHVNGVSLMHAGDLDAPFKVKRGGWAPLYAAQQVTSVPEIAARLVDTYLLNEGTDSEFIACYTISKSDRISEKGKQIWADWRALSAALKSSQTAPAVQAEQHCTLPDDFDFDRFNDVVWLEAVASNPHMHSVTTSTIAMVALELNRKLDQLSGNTEQVSQPDAIDANLVEALRLVQCMLEDYRERNYGDAERWIRHINDLMSDYSEAHGDDAYSVLHGLLPAAPMQETE